MAECKKCNKKPVSKTQYVTIIGGFYVLGSSIFGTIKLVEIIISLF
jgi:hypothetical protein